MITVHPGAPDAAAIARAAERLRRGGLVAFPTETVYGLGVHALDRAAVRRLFDAKQRPATDPLIVHVSSLEDVAPLATAIPDGARALAARFWPGPLTLVLRRSDAVPDEITAGLETVAVRVPAHPVARALLAAAGVPVAAPSANLFSRPSPTRAAHVLQDLAGRIDMVVDGGATTVGVESTVLDLSGDTPTVLRPGAVTLEMLREVLPHVRMREPGVVAEGTAMASPGLLTKHYSPRAQLTLYEGDTARVLARMAADAARARDWGKRVALLVAAEDVPRLGASGDVAVHVLGPAQDLEAIAAGLYAAFRDIDTSGADLILARGFPAAHGLGVAIQDRLRRAAAGRIVHC